MENVLGHDAAAMKASPGFQVLMVRCVEWAATGEVKTPVPTGLKGKWKTLWAADLCPQPAAG